MKELTIKEALLRASYVLKDHKIENPYFESQMLLKHVLQCRLIDLSIRDGEKLSEVEQEAFEKMVSKRAKHYPFAYITGKREFMGLEFNVTEDVLIPRPDTEILVEWALSKLELSEGVSKIADVGTGSGAIAITIAKLCENVRVYATEIWGKSIQVASKNAKNLGVSEKTTIYQGDLLQPVIDENLKMDMVLSNLPYISDEDYLNLDKTVKEYEPKRALIGGKTGLELYQNLLPQAFKVLKDNGWIALEIGYDQGETSERLLQESGFKRTKILYDLGGNPRVIVGQKVV
ncbi:peptide chain release factor N(5)-glutamine methyltransferase [Proteinivorax hydrogeniformans]|uniref:Release factor glutamine methyltransferase n=1 Tax=Proteinivorax hydrogeniformans TaxID=1826727 RepID=A0AAU8HTC9_9FIRM